MAFLTKTGSLALNTSTGNQAVTGVGFQPKVVLFYLTFETADTDDFGSSGSISFGIGVSSTSRAAISRAQGSASATRTSDTKCLSSTNTAGTLFEADLVSLDSDGFTINITTAPPSAFILNYIALGGSDLTNVALKEITAPASTGSQATTGIGFKPDAILVFSAGLTTAITTNTAHAILGLGFGTSSSARGTSTTVDITRFESTSKLITVFSSGSTKSVEADLTSLDSDGFTLNFSTTTSGAFLWVLCLKGGQYYVGSDTQKTSTGTKANTGPGFNPSGLILTSVNDTVGAAADTTHARLVIGSASSVTARSYVWTGDATGAVDSRALNRTNIIASYVESNSSLPVQTQADLSSFDSTGFTLNWTTADATAREFLIFAMGNSAGTTTSTTTTTSTSTTTSTTTTSTSTSTTTTSTSTSTSTTTTSTSTSTTTTSTSTTTS